MSVLGRFDCYMCCRCGEYYPKGNCCPKCGYTKSIKVALP